MPQPHRPVVVLGDLKARQLAAVRAAAVAVGASVVTCAEGSAPTLEGDPLAIFAPTQSGCAFERCAQVRSDPRLARVPVIVLGAERTSLAFGDVFLSGGDDLVRPSDVAALTRRLRAAAMLAGSPDAKPAREGSEGHVVLAGPASRWLTVVGRALSNAGVATRFVSDGAEAIEASSGAKAVVAMHELGPGGALAAVSAARAAGSDTPWVIVAEPRRVAELAAAVQPLAKVAIVDSFAPPENALFAANELAASSSGADNRAAPRLLYGTAVSFRIAGREDEDEVGFTYNVSQTGLYVRTLAPPDRNTEVWLELWAPRTPRRVRLAGRVAWSRRFGPSESATVPPGCGIQLTEGLAGDLERWREGCALLELEEQRVRPPRPGWRDRSSLPHRHSHASPAEAAAS